MFGSKQGKQERLNQYEELLGEEELTAATRASIETAGWVALRICSIL